MSRSRPLGKLSLSPCRSGKWDRLRRRSGSLASSAFGDYPYSLDPRFAVLKYKLMGMIAGNTAMITDQALRKNGRIMRNGVQERAGQDPLPVDKSPAQFCCPVMS